jgi:cytochrome c biogenesis protein CcmG, thiol:disulfide interchange protein DsbE
MPSAALVLAAAAIVLPGCDSPQGHASVGRPVGQMPLVSLSDPSAPPPAMTGKITLLNFWGTWCPPCRRELPGIARLAALLADEPRFQLLAVSCGPGGPDDLDEIRSSTQAFLTKQKLDLDTWADPDGFARMTVAETLGFNAFPTTYLIGPDGLVRAAWVGYRPRDEADMARAILELL